MPVLYSWTALLKKRRDAAILFSRSVSSACNCWKLALGLEVPDRPLQARTSGASAAGEHVFGRGLLRRPCAVTAALRA